MSTSKEKIAAIRTNAGRSAGPTDSQIMGPLFLTERTHQLLVPQQHNIRGEPTRTQNLDSSSEAGMRQLRSIAYAWPVSRTSPD
ncbi:hypothetical protein C3F09_07935, partial [candidate division GN15 bacterium]